MTTTQMFKPSTVAKMATGPTAQYILTLQGMPKDDDNRPEAALAIMESMTQKEASALIDTLKAANATAKPAKVEIVTTVVPPKFTAEKGQWHVVGSKFYLVAKSQSTGKLYAKERLTQGGFAYAKGVLFKLSNETMVSAKHTDLAAAFGKLTNHCVFCYTPIDTPESMTAGYGPTCAENRGLPWG